MSVTIARPVAASSRVLRRPSHSFQLRHRPFEIQPFALAPVLPGETLKAGLLQARVVSDPIKHPLVGWWYEMYLFYVRHRDMEDSEHFQNMVLQPGYDLSAATMGAASPVRYSAAGQVDWAWQCLRPVVKHYFRDDGESYDQGQFGELPVAQLNGNSWLDSALPDSAFPQGQAVPAGSTPNAADILLQQFELMREMKLTTMTYEQFLQSYGVRPQLSEPKNKPELIRYVRDWNYPSNTVNPEDGSAASAMSWSIAERADKDRYFAEPGFIFGCAVARPKVYRGKQAAAAASWLNDAMSWLPALMAEDPQTSLKKFAAGTGPVPSATEDYWIDMRDLFLYGDQFVNFALAGDGAGAEVALPTPALQRKYPSSEDMDRLFKSASANKVRCDGVLSLQIAGAQRDHT